MRGTSRDIRNGERGAAYVEFLIAFMPVFTFFAGIVQYALMSTAQVFVDHAATVAARTAALALGRPGVTENAGQQDTPVRLGTEREGLVRKAVVLTLAPLILDGTALQVNIDYPKTADPLAPDDPSQTFAAMTYTATPYIRTRVQMRMACLIPVANRLMCGSGLFDPTKWLQAESVFPVERATYQPKQGCEPPLTDQGVVANDPVTIPNGPNAPGVSVPRGGPIAQNGPGSQYGGWVCDTSGSCHPGSGPDMCFVAGTPVLTPQGERPIEDIEIGDLVETSDPETGVVGAYPVVSTSVRLASSIVEVSLAGARGETSSVRVTPEHPFWTVDRGWVPAAELASDEATGQVDGSEGHVAFVAAVPLEALVYNIEVADAHTYVVGTTHTLVHNKCGMATLLAQCPMCSANAFHQLVNSNPNNPMTEVFWTGQGSEQAAETFANNLTASGTPALTLESAPTLQGGQNCVACMTALGVTSWQPYATWQFPLFQGTSANYAQAASTPTVYVVVPAGYNPCRKPPNTPYLPSSQNPYGAFNPYGKVWGQSEYGALQRNGTVQQICYVNQNGTPVNLAGLNCEPQYVGGNPGCIQRGNNGRFP